MAGEEQIDAGTDDGLGGGGLGVGGEVARLAFERKQDLKVGVAPFELDQLMQVSAKGLGGIIRDAGDVVCRAEGHLQICVGISD